MSKILKLRRGLASTMSGAKASTVLAAGEIFAELPNTGVGTGTGKFKMGDGVTPYSQLPYFMQQTDPTTSEITITADSSSTSTAALNNVTSNTALGSLIGSLKQAISLTKSELTQSIDDCCKVGNQYFYFDYHDGEYGYNTSSSRGADTFFPFNSGTKTIEFVFGYMSFYVKLDLTDYTKNKNIQGQTGGTYNLANEGFTFFSRVQIQPNIPYYSRIWVAKDCDLYGYNVNYPMTSTSSMGTQYINGAKFHAEAGQVVYLPTSYNSGVLAFE